VVVSPPRPARPDPRPETEVVAGVAIDLAGAVLRPIVVADLGTGSGVIGLAVVDELPAEGVTVGLTDFDLPRSISPASTRPESGGRRPTSGWPRPGRGSPLSRRGRTRVSIGTAPGLVFTHRAEALFMASI
jgi:hypothetical protein